MQVTTNASAVFDEIRTKKKLKNDAELARELKVAQSMVCAMRKQAIPLGNAMQKRILEGGFMSARRIKALLES